jgi:hypothetical protein
MAVSFRCSYISHQWHWFGRSGSIVTIAGLFVSLRPLLRIGFAQWHKALRIINGGNFEPTHEEIEEDKQSELDARASKVGFLMTWAGTLIWGYGDLLGDYF